MTQATIQEYELPSFVADTPMPKCIRRSVLALSIDDAKLGDKADASWADAIILDWTRLPGRDWQADLAGRMPAAIGAAARGGAEVFVRVDAGALAAELGAAVFHGVTGVVIRGVSGAQHMLEAARCLEAVELSRGIAAGSLEIDVEVDNAGAVWHSLEIARASGRFGCFILNEPALCRALGMQTTPQLEFDPLEYIKSQLITVATSVGAMALGMSYPLGLTEQDADAETVQQAVKRARDTGFKGAVCAQASWVRHCNEGFQPSAAEGAYYLKVIEVFAEGIKRGMASVPLDGKMLDVPVDLRAKLYLNWANRAKARDEAKANAHAKAKAHS